MSEKILILAFFVFACSQVRADSVVEETVVDVPSANVCVGYHPPTKTWGFESSRPGEWYLCPEHFAFTGVTNLKLRPSSGNVEVSGSCCPLPAEDILTDKHCFVELRCPRDTVVTGLQHFSTPNCLESCRRSLRCTRINVQKYELGPVHSGVQWGISTSATFPWLERKRIRKDEIPMAIRYGVSRLTRALVTKDGCIGEPVGSLLVGKGKKKDSCKDGSFWRELRYRSSAEGAESTQAVKMYPECRDIDDIFSPAAKCVK